MKRILHLLLLLFIALFFPINTFAQDAATQKQLYDKAQDLWGDAVAYGKEENYEMAFEILQKLAEQEYTDAYRSLALCYEYGYGCQQDEEKTWYWYRQAADNGNESALLWLGDTGEKWNRKFCENYLPRYYDAEDVFYLNEMVDEDDDDAEYALAQKYWYRSAAVKGDANAQYMMGAFYAMKDSMFHDKDTAKYWFGKAARQGHDKARQALKVLH